MKYHIIGRNKKRNMKTKNTIRYRLSVSRVFPNTHPRNGEETYFMDKILRNFDKHNECFTYKLHTIRANFSLWEKRMKKVNDGEAVIELFYWEGKPYNSKQVVFATLDKTSGCGLQEVFFYQGNIFDPVIDGDNLVNTPEIAKNDGLSLEDFKAWFKKYDLSEPMAIIQFTKFRY